MSIFSEAAARGIAAVHAVMAEDFKLTPMRVAADDPDGFEVDATRPFAVVPAILFDPTAKPLIPNGFDPRTDQRPGTAGSEPRLEIAPTAAMAVSGFRRGDILTKVEGGSRWRVVSAQSTPRGLVVLKVNAL